MSPRDTGFPRDPAAKKRMLPSVTDVVRELAKVVSADPAVLFKAARGVVAEELAKVKQGFESAPLDVLVKRARNQLEREGSATPIPEPSPPPMPVFPTRPPAPRATRDLSPSKAPAADEPFENASSRAELGWEKEIHIQSEDAPFRSAILPIPSKARGPAELGTPIVSSRAAESAPPPVTFVADTSPPATQTIAPTPGPGSPDPVTFVSPGRGTSVRAEMPAPREEKPGNLFEDAPAQMPLPLAPPPIASAPDVPLAPALRFEDETVSGALAAPPAAAPTPPPDPLSASGPGRFLRTSTPPPPRPEPAVKSMSEMPPLREMFEDKGADSPAPSMEHFAFKPAEAAPSRSAPARSSRRGWLIAVALVLAVGGGLAWTIREYVFRNEIVKPAVPIARSKPEAPPVATPTIAPPPAPTVAAKSASARPSTAVPRGKAAVLVTPDWTGKPTVYVIHFSSTKDRESAAKEAQKLGAALGVPAHAVEVDLGEKGVWYRVVVGTFADVDAARAFHAELEAKKVPGMGFVYEMRGR